MPDHPPHSEVKRILRLCFSFCRTHLVNIALALGLAVWAQWAVFGVSGGEVGRAESAADMLGIIENCAALAFIFLWCSLRPRAKWALPAAAALLIPASPLRLMTGGALLTAQNADTFFGTDAGEALSFMSSIPPGDFLLPGAAALLVLALTARGLKSFSESQAKLSRRWGFAALAVSPLIFITSPLGYILYGLSASFDAPPVWKPAGVLETGAEVRNYVLVMGETLRADALPLYGFKAETTPFLSSVPVRSVSRMVSVSMATNSAVPHFLALSDESGKVRPADNVLMLAREAGLRTYWISAQGKQKSFELPISRIAKTADETVFVERHSDFALIPALEDVLSRNPDDRRRFIVLHAYGSHEDPCARIEDFGLTLRFGREEVLDCYAVSAMKADEVLRRTAQVFERRGESYSVIFTSDHALAMYREPSGKLRWQRNPHLQTQYLVPFIAFGTNIRESAQTEAEKSALDFPAYFPTWIGIRTNETPAGFDLFSEKDGTKPVRILTLSGRFKNFDALKTGDTLNDLTGLIGPEKTPAGDGNASESGIKGEE